VLVIQHNGSPRGVGAVGYAKPAEVPVRSALTRDGLLVILWRNSHFHLNVMSGRQPDGSGGVNGGGWVSRFPNPSNSAWRGDVAALLRAARIDGCTAASPEKPLDLGRGRGSGSNLPVDRKRHSNIPRCSCKFRTAGDRSNATAFENFGCGGVSVRETRPGPSPHETCQADYRQNVGRGKDSFDSHAYSS